MILTEYVIYRGKKKSVKDLSPTSGYKVDVQCPECKKIRNVHYSSICRAGHTMCQSCSARNKMGKILDIGSKYNRLTILKPSTKTGYSVCECECGTIKEIDNYQITTGGTKSCGCLLTEHIKSVTQNPIGEDHWNWKGGITCERNSIMSQIEYKQWREDVFERDKYTCQKCNRVGRNLHAHHIHSFSKYPELRLEVDNGITLCQACHKEFHKINGFDTDQNQLDEFLNEI